MKTIRAHSCFVLMLTVSVFVLGWPRTSRAVGIYYWGDFTTSYQTLEAEGRNNKARFTGPRSNLHIGSSVRKDLYAYNEFHFGPGDQVKFHQMYFTLDKVYEDFTLKAGRFALGFGLPFYYRSDHAEAGQNSLVGNPLVDPYTTQDGAELLYRGSEYSLRGALTTGSSQPGVSLGRSFGKTLRLYRYRDELGWSFSYHTSDQSSVEETTNFLVDPAPEAYGKFSKGGTTTTKVTSPGNGDNLETFQFDLRYDPGSNWTANLFFGQLEDDTSAGKSKIVYYNFRYKKVLTGKINLTGQFGEARYRQIEGSSPAAETVRRFQIGLTHHYSDRSRFKLEYVRQETDSGLAGELDTRRPLDFSGLITQVHVNF